MPPIDAAKQKEAPTEVRASPLVLANWPLTHDPHAGTKRCEDWSGQHFVILTDEAKPTRACNDEAAVTEKGVTVSPRHDHRAPEIRKIKIEKVRDGSGRIGVLPN